MTTMIYMLAAFCVFSVLGWVLEVCYRSCAARKFINPGLLAGPYLILYGTGALVLVAVGRLMDGSGLAVRALAYLVLMTGLELISGFLAEGLFRVRLWDYSDQRFNYRGRICPRFTAYWVAAAFAFEYLVYPAYCRLLAALPAEVPAMFAAAVGSAMLADFVIVAGRRVAAIIPRTSESLRTQYEAVARPLLERPEVARLSRYRHHLATTRLEHVDEVAYLSYLWGKRLGLDCNAIVRGALLHDLFYYDWLTEGPRLHGLRHPRIALENARRLTDLSAVEEDIIIKHMWPLTVVPPLYPESFIVSAADTVCAVRDYLSLKDYVPAGRSHPTLLGLQPERVRRYADTLRKRLRKRIGSALRR
jgi:uncharacterized protein